MSTVKQKTIKLKEAITKYERQGQSLVYYGFRYFLDGRGTICCRQNCNITDDTVDILEGTTKICSPIMDQKYRFSAKKLILPSTLHIIGSYAFFMSHIDKIDFGGTRRICSYAFDSAELGHIVLPETVETIERAAFSHTKFGSFTIGRNVRSIGEWSFMDSNITSIDMSKCAELTEIAMYAFYKCSRLKTVQLPPNLEKLGIYAFSESAVTAADMQSLRIDTIPVACFRRCPKLNTVRLPYVCRNVAYDAFRNCPKLMQLYTTRELAEAIKIPDSHPCIIHY